jgi:antitoxin MazE
MLNTKAPKQKTSAVQINRPKMVTANAVIGKWGNSLAVRLTCDVTSVSGVTFDTPVAVFAEQGRIVIEAIDRLPTLDEMLDSFDPKKHAGEIMRSRSVGLEIL